MTYGAAAYAIAGYETGGAGEINKVDRWTEVVIMMIMIMTNMAKPWYLESGGWLGDDGQLPLHEPQVSIFPLLL